MNQGRLKALRREFGLEKPEPSKPPEPEPTTPKIWIPGGGQFTWREYIVRR